jgi:outer membrane protein OmpA-like peptidoglycan-associated protein
MKLKLKTTNSEARLSRSMVALLSASTLSVFLTPVSFANVVGSDMQNFNATTNGLDFVTVESSETLQQGFLNFGLFMNYAVNTLPYFETTSTVQSRNKFNDTLLGADLNVGYGVSKNLDLGLSLPQVVTSSVKVDGRNGKFRDNGNTEVRMNAKYKLVGDDKQGIAVQGLVNINRTKDNPYVGQSNAPIYSIVLIGSKQVTNELGMGVNLGYRIRQSGAALPEADPIKPLGNQIIWSGAVNYRIESLDSKIVAEIFGSNPVKKTNTNNDRTASSSEALLGIKHDVDTNLALHSGFGTEIANGQSSPDWRIYAGLNYALGPKFEQPPRVTPQEAAVIVPESKPFDVEPKPFEKIVIHDVMFEFDSDHLVLGASKTMLKELADHLKKPPMFTKLIIVGHTDDIGSAEYNDQLSQRRAETIKKWLVKEEGLDASKVFAEGHGEREPVAGNGNFQGRQINRRVEFRITRDQEKEESRSQINEKAAEGAVDPANRGADKAIKTSKTIKETKAIKETKVKKEPAKKSEKAPKEKSSVN